MGASGQCIAVVSGKGGTGKTSFVAGVGAALAMSGRQVLCLDCDIGLRNLDLALGLTDRALMDFTDVAQGICDLDDAVAVHPRIPGLHLLTAPVRLSSQAVTTEQMRALLRQVRSRFDYCLLDAPAGLGTGFSWPPAPPTNAWWSPVRTPPPCGTPSTRSWSWVASPPGGCIWW